MGFPEDLWSGGFDKDWGAAGLGADLTLGMGGMGVNAGILGFGKENWGNWLSGLGRLVDPGGIFEGAQQAKWSPEAYQPDAASFQVPQFWDTNRKALAGQLGQRALGKGGPSAAELQMQQGLGSIRAGQQSMARSSPGASPGLAMRQAMLAGTDAGGQMNSQMGILRAREQMAAQQAYGDLIGQAVQQQMGGAMGYEQMMGQQQMQMNALALQQAIENAKLSQVHQGGVLSGLGGMIGSFF
jgi:hypothetical protein